MDLNSGRLITRNIVREIPVTDTVIKAVETITYAEGFKSLKFKNRHGVIFHDADWIAGVDYDENDEDDDDDDNDENQQEADDDLNGEELEQIGPDEVDDLILDEREEGNPNIQNGNEPLCPMMKKKSRHDNRLEQPDLLQGWNQD
jgi:hypothetical protein